MMSKTVKTAGLMLAVAGAVSIANAQGPGGQGRTRQRPQMLSAEEMITKYDKDADGKLSADELTTMTTEMRSRRQGKGEGQGSGGRRGGGIGMTREQMLEKYDADKDGKLNDEERAKMMEDIKAQRSQTTTSSTTTE